MRPLMSSSLIETSEKPVTADIQSFERIVVRSKFFFEGARKFFIKGVTYGPFEPADDGIFLPTPERVREDLLQMTAGGVNLVRIYHVPPKWFLDLCIEHGVRVLVSIPWTQHVEFLRDKKVRKSVIDAITNGVAANAGHPAIFGYYVGNEIPSSMVRWLGVQKVTEFVEELIARGRRVDPGALFSYATYPPTEFLVPSNADFVSYNVYLHSQDDFDRYLARLQNIAGDRPLITGEFGMDTIRHTEEEQAEMLRWHVESVVRGGLAGTILFSWTDEWFTGGVLITDWAFGLVRADRSPKKAWEVISGIFSAPGSITRHVKLESYPKVSIIVCSYNGAQTLESCLEALSHIDYPDYEVVLVDDGSKDNTQEIAAKFPNIVNIKQVNMGLSYARNVGAAASTGEIIAYTDSDCMPEPDWLYYLVGTLLSGDYAGVGGPNISPPAKDWIQACVSASPGGPCHVLLTDVVAEHIPGCNMAFHRWAFDKVGGFDDRYRKAGDDVDFCWRLQQEGGVIAFSPSAVVWHYRRFTLKAFFNQQKGYGEAESMLRFKHLIFFGPTGNARWKGRVYEPLSSGFSWFLNRTQIYHGVLGSGLFQSIYPAPQSELAAYLRSIEWVALTVFMLVLSVGVEGIRIVPYLMFGGTFMVALGSMMRARIEPKHDTAVARLLVAFLALVQPLMRGWARYFTWLRVKRTPLDVITSQEEPFQKMRHGGSSSRMVLWSETLVDREKLLTEIFATLEKNGWSYSMDTGWKSWDAQIYGNFWWMLKLRAVTEYHGGQKCLTRVRLAFKPVITTVLFHSILLPILLYRQFFSATIELWLWVPYILFSFWIGYRASRLKSRVAELVESAAQRCGMDPAKMAK